MFIAMFWFRFFFVDVISFNINNYSLQLQCQIPVVPNRVRMEEDASVTEQVTYASAQQTLVDEIAVSL